jgi:regulator of replication initiation timing
VSPELIWEEFMAVFDELKSIGKVLQEAGKIDLYRQILEIQEKLLEMQRKISDLEIENQDLRGKLELKERLHFERNAYWIVDGKSENGPFCSKCKDSEGKLVRMRVGKYNFGWAYCPNCNTCTPE